MFFPRSIFWTDDLPKTEIKSKREQHQSEVIQIFSKKKSAKLEIYENVNLIQAIREQSYNILEVI